MHTKHTLKYFLTLVFGLVSLINSIAYSQPDGSLDATFNPGTGTDLLIRKIAVQADGKIIICGDFNTYNGTSRNRIARLNTNGSLDDTFNPGTGADLAIRNIAVQDNGKIIICGDFTSYNGTTINRIARLNVNGSLDDSFNPGTGASNNVNTIALQEADGKIVIGGNFTTFNGTGRNRIARLNANGSLDVSFNPGTGASNNVNTIALQEADGKIVIGGNFTTFNGTGRNRIARLNANGSLDDSFNPGTGANASVETIAMQADGNIIIGGNFTTFNSTSINRIARLNTNGILDDSFNPGTGAGSTVNSISLQSDGKIVIVGMNTFNGILVSRIARLNTNGSLDDTFNPGIGTDFNVRGANNIVRTTALQADGNIIIGGDFTSYSDSIITRIARLFGSYNCTTPATPTISGTTTFCTGGSTLLTSSAETGNLWSTGATSRSINVTTAGNYTLRVIVGTCTSATSSVVPVSGTGTLLPATPIISGTATYNAGGSTTLTSSSATGNLWSNGATTQSITVNTMGSFNVRLVSGGCTSAVSNTIVVDLNVSSYNVTTFAGSGSVGNVNGTGTEASFNNPNDVAVDGAGNVYVADRDNSNIRKISPAGVVTTLAGTGTSGNANGIGTSASFNLPTGVVLDVAGNIIVADRNNNRLRKISPAGVVTYLAGTGTSGLINGLVTSARFQIPVRVAFDGVGNIYVADWGTHVIRKVSPAGVVSTFAGSGTLGFANGVGTEASFNGPSGVAVDGVGNVYVGDRENHCIRKISPDGEVTTFAGSGTRGFADGAATSAQFNNPTGVAFDGAGNLYVTDESNSRIRKISPAGVVTTIAGSGSRGSTDGIGTLARFSFPTGVCVDVAGNLYVADQIGLRIRKLSPVSCSTPTTPTVTGTASFCSGSSTVLTSSAATGNLWSTGETTQSITVTSAGNFTVRVTDGTCTSGVSATTGVTANSLPTTPTINSTGGTQICLGETTTLSAGVADGYLWSNGATMPSITVGSGTYSVRTINASGCTSAVSAGITVNSIVCQNVFTGTGTFGTNGNWSTNAAPLSSENAVIDGIATLTGNVTVNNLTVNANRSIEIPSGLTLTINGNLSNSGTISGDGTLLLAGTLAQTFGGGTINNLTVSNTVGVQMNNTTTISGTLTLSNNVNLNLDNRRLVIASGPSGTARLAQVPASASITNTNNFT
ncbi:MAG: hypothetical protein ACOVMN_06610, partial [Flexibacteraceae bacterium]